MVAAFSWNRLPSGRAFIWGAFASARLGLYVRRLNEDAGDGLIDLTLKFDRQAVVAALGTVSDGDVITLQVSGELLDGTSFDGEDVIVIKKKK